MVFFSAGEGDIHMLGKASFSGDPCHAKLYVVSNGVASTRDQDQRMHM
jgi:hypothetical protein